MSVTGSMADTLGRDNPFRYRSYYYDNESGLYYLNSRYYDPVTGRFVNADEVVSDVGKLQGYNLFAYCFNNPVSMSDESGNWPKWLENIGKAIVDGFSNFGKAVWATVQSFNAEIGIGTGFRAGADVAKSVSADFGIKEDYVNVQIGSGKADIGRKISSGASVTAGPVTFGNEQSTFHTYRKHDGCTALAPNSTEKDIQKCPATVMFSGTDTAIGIGFEAYFIVGATVNLSFDFEYWTNELIRIYME